VPKLEPEVEFSVATFAHELAKYLNFTVRRPGMAVNIHGVHPEQAEMLLDAAAAPAVRFRSADATRLRRNTGPKAARHPA